MHTNFQSKNLKGGIGVDIRIILKCTLKIQGLWMWTGFIWLRIGSRGGFLGT
jgi:hypothetical protein